MRRRQKFTPFVVYDVHAFIKTFGIAAEKVEDGYKVVRQDLGSPINVIEIAEAQIPRRWGKGEADPVLKAERLKLSAIRDGATPEAIRLLGLFTPITKQEEAQMAEKLKAKGKATADKAGLKAAAKAAPVGKKAGGEAPAKRKGNLEALAKARAARQETGPDKRKIVVLKKDHGARAGTKRADLLNSIFKAKTAQAAIDAGVSRSDLSWATREEYIRLD